jgi:hypothetical protein
MSQYCPYRQLLPVGLVQESGILSDNVFTNLRYRLSEHFSINTRAGETQRIDLKYHVKIE